MREIVAKDGGEEPLVGEHRESIFRLISPSNVSCNKDINNDSIPESLQKASITPDQPGYDRVRSTYLREGTPGLVMMTSTAQ